MEYAYHTVHRNITYLINISQLYNSDYYLPSYKHKAIRLEIHPHPLHWGWNPGLYVC